MVLLKSNDGLTVEVDEVAALQSRMVKLALEESSPERGIPLENVKANVLSKIVEYMTKQTEFTSQKPHEMTETENSPELQDEVAEAEKALKKWKKEVEIWEETYIDVSIDMLYDLYLAANYMDIEGLLYLCAAKIASLIRGKTVEEIRETLKIENDLTPEEEAEYRAKNQWVFAEC